VNSDTVIKATGMCQVVQKQAKELHVPSKASLRLIRHLG